MFQSTVVERISLEDDSRDPLPKPLNKTIRRFIIATDINSTVKLVAESKSQEISLNGTKTWRHHFRIQKFGEPLVHPQVKNLVRRKRGKQLKKIVSIKIPGNLFIPTCELAVIGSWTQDALCTLLDLPGIHQIQTIEAPPNSRYRWWECVTFIRPYSGLVHSCASQDTDNQGQPYHHKKHSR